MQASQNKKCSNNSEEKTEIKLVEMENKLLKNNLEYYTKL